jgi:hypothetical protein
VERLDANAELGLIENTVRIILESSVFRSSKQCQILLRYIVDQSLACQDDLLRERVIGAAVFGRAPDYDCGNDPVVRARVNEVRKRLAQYYDGHRDDSAVRISIPSGSYRAVFETAEMRRFDSPSKPNKGSKDDSIERQPQTAAPHGTEENPEPQTSPLVPVSSRATRWRVLGITGAAACAVLLISWIVFANWKRTELDLFWGPFLENTKPVVIYMGTAQLYIPAAASTEKALSLLAPSELKQPMSEWPLPELVEGQVLTANDVLVDRKDFVGAGDIAAVVSVASYLSAHHRNLDLRSGPNLPFEDLRGSPVILTGAGSNYWTLDIARDLPFFVDRGLRIRERGGQGRVWTTPLWSDHTIAEDYAIVARLLDSKTGAPVVILAGITMCGNRAAGEFVTDQVQLKKLGTIPRDAFEHKNIEIILHTTLSNCTPTSMDVEAQRYW